MMNCFNAGVSITRLIANVNDAERNLSRHEALAVNLHAAATNAEELARSGNRSIRKGALEIAKNAETLSRKAIKRVTSKKSKFNDQLVYALHHRINDLLDTARAACKADR